MRWPWRRTEPPYAAFGERILTVVRDLLREDGATPASLAWLDQQVRGVDRRRGPVRTGARWTADLLGALTPGYRDALWDYYRAQEYTSLLGALQYPFCGPTLDAFVRPYEGAANILKRPMSVTDYGCCMPYGALWMLLKWPGALTALTLVDLEHAPLRMAARVIGRIAPALPLTVIGLRDVTTVPKLPHADFVFARDVFEHLPNPGRAVRAILNAAPRVVALDLKDRDEMIYQHISIKLRHLVSDVERAGWLMQGAFSGMTMFLRRDDPMEDH